MYQDYLQTAEKLQGANRWSCRYWTEVALFTILTSIIACGPLFYFLWFARLSNPQQQVGTEFLVAIAASACWSIVFYIGAIIAFSWHYSRILKNRLLVTASEIDRSKPGFLNFFTTWLANKEREALIGGLTLIGGVAVAGVTGISVEASEDARMRRALDSELRRRGL